MKAVITKIENSKIWAKTLNPLGEKPKSIFSGDNHIFDNYTSWSRAESERIELQILEGDFSSIHKLPFVKIGDQIEVTQEGNYFKII